jgi:hypothetical protein
MRNASFSIAARPAAKTPVRARAIDHAAGLEDRRDGRRRQAASRHCGFLKGQGADFGNPAAAQRESKTSATTVSKRMMEAPLVHEPGDPPQPFGIRRRQPMTWK